MVYRIYTITMLGIRSFVHFSRKLVRDISSLSASTAANTAASRGTCQVNTSSADRSTILSQTISENRLTSTKGTKGYIERKTSK